MIYHVRYRDQSAEIEAAAPDVAALAFIIYCARAAQEDYLQQVTIIERDAIFYPLHDYLAAPGETLERFKASIQQAKQARILSGSRQDWILSDNGQSFDR